MHDERLSRDLNSTVPSSRVFSLEEEDWFSDLELDLEISQAVECLFPDHLR